MCALFLRNLQNIVDIYDKVMYIIFRNFFGGLNEASRVPGKRANESIRSAHPRR
jgi:hypothetical protein